MLVRQGRDTLLVAGVPRSRGTPVHYEHPDDTAFTQYESGRVTEIHTPQQGMVRIHELLHARHTSRKRYNRVYKDVPDFVGQILEDCRIHTKFWPWRPYQTPASVQRSIRDYFDKETAGIQVHLAKDPSLRGSWQDFASRLRLCAVVGAIEDDYHYKIDTADFADGQEKLARSVIGLLRKNKEAQAAALIATAFGYDLKPKFLIAGGGAGRDGSNLNLDGKIPVIRMNGIEQPDMEIIELPHSEHVEGASVGERRATMGSRMYRPALRRPLLPQRLFVRRTPIEPGGTILIDASGSMGDFEYIERWCERAPFGTIAYYAGNGGRRGWLYVYARDGKRAKELIHPASRGNTVDGPALTWLMTQPGPRILVSDMDFCDAADSCAQRSRAFELQRTGELTIENYHRSDDVLENPDE